MPVYIDCYNLLHAPKPTSLAGLDEQGLVDALARSRWAGDRIFIVCDGAPKPHDPDPLRLPAGVELVYSGPNRTADAVVIDAIERSSAPRKAVAVSNDRAIQRAARRRRARVWSADRFLHALAADRRVAASADGPSHAPIARGDPSLPASTLDEAEQEAAQDEGGGTDAWLRWFGLDPDDPDGSARR